MGSMIQEGQEVALEDMFMLIKYLKGNLVTEIKTDTEEKLWQREFMKESLKMGREMGMASLQTLVVGKSLLENGRMEIIRCELI